MYINTISAPLKISCCISIAFFFAALFISYSSCNHDVFVLILKESCCKSYHYIDSPFKDMPILSYIYSLMRPTVGI